jgi:hypothetical protein
MKHKLINAIFLFVIIFIISILREVYIGELIAYGKPVKWDEVPNNLYTYFTISFLAVFIYLYFEFKNYKNRK